LVSKRDECTVKAQDPSKKEPTGCRAHTQGGEGSCKGDIKNTSSRLHRASWPRRLAREKNLGCRVVSVPPARGTRKTSSRDSDVLIKEGTVHFRRGRYRPWSQGAKLGSARSARRRGDSVDQFLRGREGKEKVRRRH